MTPVVYREATEKDLPALEEVYADLVEIYLNLGYRLTIPENVGALWVDSFRRTLGKFSQVFVAEDQSKLAGFALVRLKRLPPYQGGEIIAELSDLFVAEAARHQGISTRLSQIVIEWAKEKGATSIEAQILTNNIASQRMFTSLGFNEELTQVRLELDLDD